MNMKEAMFAAGCFWGVEYYFSRIPGVLDTMVGYSGGVTLKPSYKEVCEGKTGHAEVVHIFFNPKKIAFKELLEHFWHMHDPTTLNRQGPDIGPQYRSAIFYYDSEQMNQAMDSMRGIASLSQKTIVTEISQAGIFWPAEDYHQRYFEKNPEKKCHVR